MANINWQGGKVKSVQQAKAFFRHNDKTRRQEQGHENPHIKRSLTPYNWSLYGLTYEERAKKYDTRMAAIDGGRQTTGANARTVMLSLVVYPPPALRGDLAKLRDWYADVGAVAEQFFGAENVIDMAVDVDEVHTYRDPETHEERESQEHGHLWVVPEKDGKLNGKAVCSRQSMKALNNAVDGLTREKYKTVWNDGTGKRAGGNRTVDELKAASRVTEIEAEAQEQAERRLRELERRAGENAAREDELSDREGKADARKKALDEREKALDDREKRLKAREDAVEKREEALRTPQKASESTRTAETVQNTPEQPKMPQKASSGLTGAKKSDIDPALLELLGGGTEISMDEAERRFRAIIETPAETPAGPKMRELNRAVVHTDEHEAAKQEQAREDDGNLRQFLRHSTR